MVTVLSMVTVLAAVTVLSMVTVLAAGGTVAGRAAGYDDPAVPPGAGYVRPARYGDPQVPGAGYEARTGTTTRGRPVRGIRRRGSMTTPGSRADGTTARSAPDGRYDGRRPRAVAAAGPAAGRRRA